MSVWFQGSAPNPSREVNGDTVMFRDIQSGSSAVYQCNASNEHGYLLANAFVSVLGKHWTGKVLSFLIMLIQSSFKNL